MRCPICGVTIENSHICPKCNENAYVLNKTYNISIRLYNEGLEKALNKDYSNAISSLEKSIYFYKNNAEARNLLGLLYYQTGRLGDAVKQWVLSSNIDGVESNKAFYYLNIFNKDIRKFEKLDDAVRLYNQAINYLKHRDDDLAVIRLKKALDINPNFIDAMNLLALCYIVQRKYKSAMNILQNTLLLDKNNKITLKYIEEIKSKRKKKQTEVLSEEYEQNGSIKTVDEDEDYNKINKNYKSISYIISFVFGVLLCGMCCYFLIIPDYIEQKNIEIKQLNEQIQTITAESQENTVVKDEAMAILQQENEQNKSKLQIYTNYEKIDIALNLYEQGNETEAKATFDTIDTTGFDEIKLKKYNELKEKLN